MRGVLFCCLVVLAVFCACAVGHGRRGGSHRGGPFRGPRINSNFTCECRINDESDDRRKPCRIQASCLNMSSVCLEKCQNKTSKYSEEERTKKICCKENNNSTVLEVTMTYTASSVQDECPDSMGTVATFTADCTTVNLDQDCRRGGRHRYRDDGRGPFRDGRFGGRRGGR